MPEAASEDLYVDVSFGDPSLSSAVLERLISAAAARANLPVDRVVNALTVVDALSHATDAVLGESARELRVVIGDGRLGLRVDSLGDGQAEAIRDAAHLPDVGDILERTASTVSIESSEAGSSLVIVLD